MKKNNLGATELKHLKEIELLEQVLENAQVAIIVTDAKHKLEYVNPEFTRIFGYSEEEAIGKHLYDLIYPEERLVELEQLTERLEKLERSEYETIRRTKDGRRIHVLCRVSPIVVNGESVGGFAFYSDISEQKRSQEKLQKAYDELEMRVESRTRELKQANEKLKSEIRERKRIEEALRESEEGYRTAIEHSNDGISIVRADRALYHNQRLAEMYGYESPEELMKIPMHDFVHPDDLQMVLDRIKRRERGELPGQRYEHKGIRKDGSPIHVEVSVAKTAYKGELASLVYTRDVTNRKKAEDELRKAKEAAEAANIAKSDFLANMSHEIRTPMNAVVGFTDMLLDTDLDEEQNDYARTIKRSGQALLSLINDILDLSKIEAGELDFEEIDFDPELLAYDVCELVRPRIGTKPVEILCHIGDDLPSKVTGDPLRVRQVLTNLMNNAAKFTESGEIELSLDCVEERDKRVKFHAMIRDTGIGIPKESIHTIFEVFHQADNSTTRRYGGTGLGLAISKHISNLMEGDVWAESEIGQGSTFHFIGWVGKAEDKEVRRSTPVSLSGRKVLIVDDNQANLDILTHVLEKAGMRVVALTNPMEAVPTLKGTREAGDPFDISITDIQMPDMSGYELGEQIRDPKNQIPNIPLIALSSSAERDAKRCNDAGFDGFLDKPVYSEKLLQMMERILGEKDEESEKEGVVKRELKTQYSVREDMKHSVRILLAEDNPVNQKLAKAMLTKAGYKVEFANDGKEAIEKYTSSPEDFDLIFMDVAMPGMDGLLATRAIREKGFDSIPIIAMTAAAMKGDKERCLKAGMVDYISKPIKRELVFEIVEKWIFDKKSS
jgi:two-component system sensor histidine kinase/response regulator